VDIEAIVIPDDLFLAARSGDGPSRASLWDSCAPIFDEAVRRNRFTPATLDPADVAQEAAVIFLRLLTTAEPSPATGAEFIHRFAGALRWRLRAYVSAERRRLGRTASADESRLERALQAKASGASRSGPPGRQIARALERLLPRQRAVVAALYFDDKPVAALARELGVTPQAVTALHRRALARLRKVLEEEGNRDQEAE
jgi:RNA polymerase sigma factor (sigma-70 family)